LLPHDTQLPKETGLRHANSLLADSLSERDGQRFAERNEHKQLGYFNPPTVRQLIDANKTGTRVAEPLVCSLLTVAIWHQTFIARERSSIMLKYYAWALAEKTLSYTPFGKQIYSSIGYLMTRRIRGRDPSIFSSLQMTREAKKLIPPGGTILELGTGWFHHDAFALYLAGDYKIYLFDVKDKAKFVYIKNYLGYLLENADRVAAALDIAIDTVHARLEPLLPLQRREELYAACNFVPCITEKTDMPFLPENSIDFMIGNCVLNHIPPSILVPELNALRRMLKPEGRMYTMIGHDDHYTFHDNSANQFNYYRYSDRVHKWIFESKFEYHNRLVMSEWFPIFEECGLAIEKYEPYITESSTEQIARLPRIDARFAKYPLEELAIIYSYVLLRRRY